MAKKAKVIKGLKTTMCVVCITVLLVAGVLLFPLTGKKHTQIWSAGDTFDIQKIQTVSKDRTDFKILLFTDTQLWSDLGKNKECYAQMDALVEKTKPDLIVLPGDVLSAFASRFSIYNFIKRMDSYQIPWAPVFGNHDSEKTPATKNCWGYPVVSGMLHDFGGKNSMQGKLRKHSQNVYKTLKDNGANVVGTGLFMEGIEQNPVVYDLQFSLLTASDEIDFDEWLKNYILRRYGKYDERLQQAWNVLLQTCYQSDGYQENEVGSAVAARPQMIPIKTGPCCTVKPYYDTKKFEQAVSLFLSASDDFSQSDGYQYDLCDITRQALSNRFYDEQLKFAAAYKAKDLPAVKRIAKEQLELLDDMDELLSHRKEFCFSRFICDAHALATDEQEKKYFDFNARTLVTQWGDIRDKTFALYDYAWREWSGLIKSYYRVRWTKFYERAVYCLEHKRIFFIFNGNDYVGRRRYRSYKFGRELNRFEMDWLHDYTEYQPPQTTDVIPSAKKTAAKWGI